MASGGKNLKEVNPQEIDDITKTPTFFHRPTSSSGKEFFYFYKIGDSIEGFLGRSVDNSSINRTKSFVIDTSNGLEEFFANRLLQKLLTDLEGKYIKVVYIGQQQTPYPGRRRKIYRVFADTGRASLQYAGETGKLKTQKELEKDGPRKTRKRTNRSNVGAG